MTFRNRVRDYFLIVAALISVSCGAQERPNVVILFPDDLGYADLGSYGNPYIRTPNLDQLAREGQRWTDFYVAAPVCSPSRGALLTGQLSVRSGLYGRQSHVMHPNDRHGIPEELLTMAEALKSAGYATGIFGKWHLGDAPEHYPTRNGFDYWYGVPYSNDMNRVGAPDIDDVLKAVAAGQPAADAERELYESFVNPDFENYDVPLYRSTKTGNDFTDELIERPIDQTTLTKRLTEEAVRYIEANAAGPFLVYLPYSMPHLPVFASEAFAGHSLRGVYGDAVEEIDWSAGQVRATLERLDIADNTLVFFASDNGPWQVASTLNAGSAGVLRGDKGTTWEGGVRVPGIFWWPGRIESAVVSDIGSALDVYATVLTLAGVDLPEGTDGVDLAATLFDGQPGPRDEMPYYHKGHLKAYRKGNYKVVFFGGDRATVELEQPLLFDLRQDIEEQQDLAAERPEVLRDLLDAVERHRAGVAIAEPIFDRRLTGN